MAQATATRQPAHDEQTAQVERWLPEVITDLKANLVNDIQNAMRHFEPGFSFTPAQRSRLQGIIADFFNDPNRVFLFNSTTGPLSTANSIYFPTGGASQYLGNSIVDGHAPQNGACLGVNASGIMYKKDLNYHLMHEFLHHLSDSGANPADFNLPRFSPDASSLATRSETFQEACAELISRIARLRTDPLLQNSPFCDSFGEDTLILYGLLKFGAATPDAFLSAFLGKNYSSENEFIASPTLPSDSNIITQLNQFGKSPDFANQLFSLSTSELQHYGLFENALLANGVSQAEINQFVIAWNYGPLGGYVPNWMDFWTESGSSIPGTNFSSNPWIDFWKPPGQR